MPGWIGVAVATIALYGLLIAWYGGRGKALTRDETERFLAELGARAKDDASRAALDAVRALVERDDGREFVMQNLVRHRAKAAYPAGAAFGDDPREADRRYGRLIIWPLLRNGSHPVFVARRAVRFIEPDGCDDWHYVAMVRYRSRRDFLRFALAIERDDIVVHKWAAIEKTHVFPVRPMASLIVVRTLVAALLALAGTALALALG